MKSTSRARLAVLLGLAFTLTVFRPAIASFNAGSNTFSAATVITSENDVSDPTNLTTFTAEPGEPGHLPGNTIGAGQTAWWSWTATQSGYCTVDTLRTANFANGILDTAIAVYTGSSVGNLTLVVSDDDSRINDSYGNARSSASFYALQGVVYHIAVDAYGPSSITATEYNVAMTLRLLPLKILTRTAVYRIASDPSQIGIATITTTATGGLSGKLTAGAKTYPFAGVFSVSGFYQVSFSRSTPVGSPPVLPISLVIDGAGNGSISVAFGTVYATATFPAKVTFSAQNPNTSAGLFPSSFTVSSGAHGIISITVAPAGTVTGAGTSFDGTAFTFSSALYTGPSPTVFTIPGFTSLAAGKGALMYNGTLSETGVTDSIAANGYYIRPVPASPTSQFYPLGIAGSMSIKTTDTYPKPVIGSRALSFLNGVSGVGQLIVTNAGGELTASFTEGLSLSTANKFTFTSLSRKPVLTLNTATGIVTGSIVEPAGVTRTIKGVLCSHAGTPTLTGYVTGTKLNLAMAVTP